MCKTKRDVRPLFVECHVFGLEKLVIVDEFKGYEPLFCSMARELRRKGGGLLRSILTYIFHVPC
jgi:hypothetical protein